MYSNSEVYKIWRETTTPEVEALVLSQEIAFCAELRLPVLSASAARSVSGLILQHLEYVLLWNLPTSPESASKWEIGGFAAAVLLKAKRRGNFKVGGYQHPAHRAQYLAEVIYRCFNVEAKVRSKL